MGTANVPVLTEAIYMTWHLFGINHPKGWDFQGHLGDILGVFGAYLGDIWGISWRHIGDILWIYCGYLVVNLWISWRNLGISG